MWWMWWAWCCRKIYVLLARVRWFPRSLWFRPYSSRRVIGRIEGWFYRDLPLIWRHFCTSRVASSKSNSSPYFSLSPYLRLERNRGKKGRSRLLMLTALFADGDLMLYCIAMFICWFPLHHTSECTIALSFLMTITCSPESTYCTEEDAGKVYQCTACACGCCDRMTGTALPLAIGCSSLHIRKTYHS